MLIRQGILFSEKASMMKWYFGRGPGSDKGSICHPLAMKFVLLISVVGSFLLPFLIIPTTVHPFMGWGVFLLGSASLLIVVINVFELPVLPVMTPWIGGFVALLVLAYPFYSNGIARALSIAGYTALSSPFLWWSLREVSVVLHHGAHREPLMAWTGVRSEPPSQTLMKIC